MKTLLLVLLLILQNNSVSLQWDPNSETDLAGYKVYQSNASGSYSTPAAVVLAPSAAYTTPSLNPGTYYWVVTAYNTAGLESGYSNEVSTIIAPPIPTAPVISAVNATLITDKTARITWTTDIASDSGVDYGLTVTYGSVSTDAVQTTTHVVNLIGLVASSVYHYRVKSGTTIGTDKTFVTAALPIGTVIKVTGPLIVDLTATTAQLTWKTDVPCTSRLEYDYGGSSQTKTVPVSSVAVTDHYIRLSGLVSGKVYNYKAISETTTDRTDATGTFKTK